MNVEIEENIRKNVPWAQLPAHIKQVVLCIYIIICKQTVMYLQIVLGDREFIQRV